MKLFTFKRINGLFLLIFIVTAYLCSCKTSEVVTKAHTNVAKLPTLYIDTGTFHHWALKNDKIMFRFTYNNKHITLTGWAMTDTINYDTSETLNLIASEQLFKIESSTLYLGNLRFSEADIAFVDSAARGNNFKYILFKPVNSDNYPDHIAYKVYVSNNTSVYAYNGKMHPKNRNRDFILVSYITSSFKPKAGTSKHIDPSPPAHQ